MFQKLPKRLIPAIFSAAFITAIPLTGAALAAPDTQDSADKGCSQVAHVMTASLHQLRADWKEARQKLATLGELAFSSLREGAKTAEVRHKVREVLRDARQDVDETRRDARGDLRDLFDDALGNCGDDKDGTTTTTSTPTTDLAKLESDAKAVVDKAKKAMDDRVMQAATEVKALVDQANANVTQQTTKKGKDAASQTRGTKHGTKDGTSH